MELVKKYYIYIIIGFITLVLIGMNYIPADSTTNEVDAIKQPTQYIEDVVYIYVDMKGAIQNPGVYKFEQSSRLFQAIQKAGGLLEDADQNAVNQSLLLQDEQVIYIPKIGETIPSSVNTPQAEEDDELINLNTATLEELQSLPGVGPSTAQKIIDFREINGDFSTIEDIVNVPGIGESTLNEIKNLITT